MDNDFTYPPVAEIDLEDGRQRARPATSDRLGSDGVTYPVGFFNFTFNEATGSGLGGLLVTDNTGIPLEFVITAAVRTTHAQRILYGKRLRSFVAVNLCGKQLLNNVKTKPRVLFVKDEWLLPVYEHTDIPVLQLIASERLDEAVGRPTVLSPISHPEFADVIDLTSLDSDMVDAFDRIEACRQVLGAKNPDYAV